MGSTGCHYEDPVSKIPKTLPRSFQEELKSVLDLAKRDAFDE